MGVSYGAACAGVGNEVGAGVLREGQTGKCDRQGKDPQRFDCYSHSLFFLSGVLCAEALVGDGIAV
jgi:hypothetical protein